MSYSIVIYPDKFLRNKCESVEKITPKDREFFKKLGETMLQKDGVGLAAIQAGFLKSVIAVAVPEEKTAYEIFVNPQITEKSGKIEAQEGCLSLPGIFANVVRAKKIKVEALTPEGKKITFDAEEHKARIFQHEIDHLNGVLFTDRLSPDERKKINPDLKELEKKNKGASKKNNKKKKKK